MKLSKLITYKHMVDGLSVNHVYDEIESILKRVDTDLNIQNIDFDNLKEKVHTGSQSVLLTLNEINTNLNRFKIDLEEFVKSIEEPYYARSIDLYNEGLNDNADYILDRYNFKKLMYEQETLDFFISRVKLYTDWKWPALEIRPAFGDVTEYLTACDPLYLVDTNEEMFKHVKKKWTSAYQNRVRYYSINESERHLFHQLPPLQFGLVVAVDFLNFRHMDLISKYLEGVFKLLRPGGTFMFTYNNCDYPIGVDNFENSYYCYTPGRKIKEICEKIGYRVSASFDLENNVSWLEVTRPGTKSSLRGGQTLGKIVNI